MLAYFGQHVFLLAFQAPIKAQAPCHLITMSSVQMPTLSVFEASMERSDRHSLLMVSAGDQPPFWPSYSMSRQMWPLL
jgi:hypothetical protein